ncbi:MAG: Lrp/AsnC family transcriptional regulator [Dehalococcoidales bacterium]|nr:Lrp/AsnC family transcriptional regulator [Dehalococcoidales bacterium]
MDHYDRSILKVLMNNGFSRASDIKTALDCSERFVRRRIRRMEDNNLLTFVVLNNPQHVLRDMGATIGIGVVGTSPDEVIAELVKKPCVITAFTTNDKFSIVLTARFDSSDMLVRFVHDELPSISGVTNVETFPSYRPLKYFDVVWPIGD